MQRAQTTNQQKAARVFAARRIGTRIAIVIMLLAFVLVSGINACSEGNVGVQPVVQPASQTTDPHANHQHTEIEFTDSDDDIWPPQPLNITNVEALNTNAEAHSHTDSKLQLVLSDAEVFALLGSNYEMLASHAITDKANKLIETELEFYLYDKNEVLTVTVSATSGEPIRHTRAESYAYQPPESRKEVQRAIQMAGTALSRQGFTDHTSLRGTGILAYPNASQTAQSGSSFFSDRKIYVTFGPGDGVLPHYRALVNLSQSLVENSGVME